MKRKNLQNLELNLEKTTISRLEQTTINGGAQNGKTIEITKGEGTCMCTWHDGLGG